jgi:hypothetical protein
MHPVVGSDFLSLNSAKASGVAWCRATDADTIQASALCTARSQADGSFEGPVVIANSQTIFGSTATTDWLDAYPGYGKVS